MGDLPLRTLNTRFRNGTVLVRASRVWKYRGGTDDGEIRHVDIVLIDSEVRLFSFLVQLIIIFSIICLPHTLLDIYC